MLKILLKVSKSQLLSGKKNIIIILTFLGLCSTVFCESFVVSGHIYDSVTNKAITGANIIIGNIGTTTDEFGGFSINVTKKSQIKIIMIGYESETIAFTTETFDIYLIQKALKGSMYVREHEVKM